MQNQIWISGKMAWLTGMTKVDINTGKECFEYRASTGERVYISKDGSVYLQG